MAGTYFLISIPCERYEEILSNKHGKETKPVKINRNGEKSNPITGSSSSEEFNYFSNQKVSSNLIIKTMYLIIR